jgi:DNA-binding PadR family transcriptional regulator
MKSPFHHHSRGGGHHSHFARGPFGHGGGFDGFGSHGPGRGGGGRGGRKRRLFDQSELQTLILSLITETPRHGYDLIKEMESISGGEYAPSPGVIYPALTFMEEQGVIGVTDAQASRKSYALTEEGRAQLAALGSDVDRLRKRLTDLAEARERIDPAPVRRALHSLRTAVFDRLSDKDADRARILEIAEIIDEAARKIERSE